MWLAWQTCLDPISGEKLLVADLSYTIRSLSVEERYNLRAENELANDIEVPPAMKSPLGHAVQPPLLLPAASCSAVLTGGGGGAWRRRQDNLLFERRSATTLSTRTIVGTEGSSSAAALFSRDDEDDVSKDGSTILLTEKEQFRHCVVLGAPACGKTTLLQKVRYWAALKAYEDADEDLPVFVALASFAAFLDDELRLQPETTPSLMDYLKATCSAENYQMLEHFHRRGKLLLLADG